MKIKWNSEQIPKMNVKNNKDVTFLTYPAYEEMNWLVHGFSTRFGGVRNLQFYEPEFYKR